LPLNIFWILSSKWWFN